MSEYLNDNMGSTEKNVRYVLGIALLLAGVFVKSVDTWVALLSIYPVMTAMMRWDPLYATIISRYFNIKKSDTKNSAHYGVASTPC